MKLKFFSGKNTTNKKTGFFPPKKIFRLDKKASVIFADVFHESFSPCLLLPKAVLPKLTGELS